jgi:hypothetical protein
VLREQRAAATDRARPQRPELDREACRISKPRRR